MRAAPWILALVVMVATPTALAQRRGEAQPSGEAQRTSEEARPEARGGDAATGEGGVEPGPADPRVQPSEAELRRAWEDALHHPVEEQELEPRSLYDPRIPGGLTTMIGSVLLLGGGIAGTMDSGGQGMGGSFAAGGITGGAVGLVAGSLMLGYGFAEGADSPRKSVRGVAAGQALTGLGLAFTTTSAVAHLHAHLEDEDFSPFVLFGYPISGAVLITGASLWLGSARDVDPGARPRTVMRSPAMAAVGGLMTAGGLGALGSSFVVLAGDDDGQQGVTALSLVAVGSLTTAFGTWMLAYGATDAEIPTWLPVVSGGPGAVSLTFEL